MNFDQQSKDKLHAFLDALGGQSRIGYFEVRCIHPDKTKTTQSRFYRLTEDLLQQWPAIEKLNAEGRIISLGVGRRKFNGGKKKDDVLQVHTVWADLDGVDFDAANWEKGKELALQSLQQFGEKMPLSCLVDSGHGYHAYWFLKEPVVLNSPADVQAVEAVNAALADTLHGDNVSDVSRVLRLPFTINFKDPTNPKPATIIEIHPDRLYQLADFDDLVPPPTAGSGSSPTQPIEVKFSGQAPSIQFETFRISQKMKDLIQIGYQTGEGYKSRSEAMQAAITAMLAGKHSADEIRAVLTAYPIGEKFREEDDKYLAYCIRSAHSFLDRSRPANADNQAGPYITRNHATYYIGLRGVQRISNFEAHIPEEVIKDNGLEVTRFYKIVGTTEGGIALPEIRVPVKDFAAMNWPLTHWSKRAVVSAGNAKDKLREAILLFSRGEKERKIFAHTGWRQLDDGQWAYLFNGGSIGGQGIEVELDGELRRYRLELPQNENERTEALSLSLALLDVAPLSITAPLWGAIFLAIYATFVEPDFALFLVGITGSLKSTLLTLVQAHFGEFEKKIHLPGSWTSTYGYLEKMAHASRDTVFSVDDFFPGATRIENEKLQQKAAQFFRSVGNRSGRGRMRSDTSLRPTYYPRSMVISTGEQIPTGGGESTVARLFIVDTQREAIDLAKVTHIQNNIHLLRKATGSFVDLVRPDLENRAAQLNTLWKQLAHSTQRKGHLRVPEAAAFLRIGTQAGLEAIREMGALNAQAYDSRLKACDDAILELAARQTDRIQDERPSFRFLRMVHDLLVGRQICLYNCGGQGCMHDVGWTDPNFYFLLSGLIMDKVKTFSHRSDEYFELSAKALHKQLYEDGFSIRGVTGNRYLVKARIPWKGSVTWVLKLKRRAVNQVAEWIPMEATDEDSPIEELDGEGV